MATKAIHNRSNAPAAARRRKQPGTIALGAVGAMLLLATLGFAATRSGGDVGAILIEAPAGENNGGNDDGTAAILEAEDPDNAVSDADEDALSESENPSELPDVANPPPVVPDAPDVGDPVSLDPVNNPEPHPCDAVLEAGENLLVSPDPSVLEAGIYVSSLTIVNCGNEAVDWTAKTKPWVTLDNQAGNLGAGSSSELGFTIDRTAVDLGAFTFKIKVSEPGSNTYVDISAFRKAVGTDFQPEGIGFTAGAQAGGCANQCITRAWLTPNATSPSLSLEVKTTVNAAIKVFVSKGAPQFDGDDNPYFPGVQAIASSNAMTSQWTAALAPLDASTGYNIIVKATDNNDKTSYRSGSFTTITPLDNPGDLALPGDAPGCLNQCITKALITPTGDYSKIGLEVKTFLPAKIAVFVSTEAPQYDDGLPSFPGQAALAGTGSNLIEQWSTDLTGLEADTTYNIIVRAIDANGHRAYQIGSFETADAPKKNVFVKLQKIRVTYDGDKSWKNRGELSFGWAVNNDLVATIPEKKMNDGTTVTFPEHKNKWAVLDIGEWLPSVGVVAKERDPDAKSEFCTMGNGVPAALGGNDDCDVKWNVATTGIYLTENIDSMQRCSEFGIDDNYAQSACVLIETLAHGDDHPRFWAIVSFDIVN